MVCGRRRADGPGAVKALPAPTGEGFRDRPNLSRRVVVSSPLAPRHEPHLRPVRRRAKPVVPKAVSGRAACRPVLRASKPPSKVRVFGIGGCSCHKRVTSRNRKSCEDRWFGRGIGLVVTIEPIGDSDADHRRDADRRRGGAWHGRHVACVRPGSQPRDRAGFRGGRCRRCRPRMPARAGGVRRLPASAARAACEAARRDRGQDHGIGRCPDRARPDRIGPAEGAPRRRTRTHGRPAQAVRGARARWPLAWRDARFGDARAQAAGAFGPASAENSVGACCRVRGKQLSARVLGGRRRYRFGPGGGLSRCGEGASGAPRNLGARRPRHPGGRGRKWPACRHLLARAWRGQRDRRGARCAPGDQGRRLHGFAWRRRRADEHRGAAPRTDSGVCRDEQHQSVLRAARCAGCTRRSDRERFRRIADAGRGAVLHESGACGGARRATPAELRRRGREGPWRRRARRRC